MSNMIRERSSGDSLTEELAAMYWESHNVVVMVIIFLLHHSWTIVFTQFYKVASLPHTMTPLKNLFLHLQLYKCINLFPFSSQKCHYNFCIKLFHAEVLYWYMGYFFFSKYLFSEQSIIRAAGYQSWLLEYIMTRVLIKLYKPSVSGVKCFESKHKSA